MTQKPGTSIKDVKKVFASDISSDCSNQVNRRISELLSQYPAKELSLEEIRSLLSSRLKEHSLSDFIRKNRDS